MPARPRHDEAPQPRPVPPGAGGADVPAVDAGENHEAMIAAAVVRPAPLAVAAAEPGDDRTPVTTHRLPPPAAIPVATERPATEPPAIDGSEVVREPLSTPGSPADRLAPAAVLGSGPVEPDRPPGPVADVVGASSFPSQPGDVGGPPRGSTSVPGPATPAPSWAPGRPAPPMASGDGAIPDGHSSCTAAQLRRFIKSRAYVPLHELRRRFELEGGEDDVSPIDSGGRRLYVGLPAREARLLAELLEAGDVGCELLLDPTAPLVVGVFPMRPVPRA